MYYLLNEPLRVVIENPPVGIDWIAWIALAISLFTLFQSNYKHRMNYVIDFGKHKVGSFFQKLYKIK